MMSEQGSSGMKNRRDFLTHSVTAAGLSAGGAFIGGKSAEAKPWERSSTHDRLIRIGALTSGFHHHLYSIWGPMINPVPATENNPTILPKVDLIN